MTRKHKPHPTRKKRPAAHASKAVKTAAEKTGAASAGVRDRERAKNATAKKAPLSARANPAHGKAAEHARAAQPKAAAAKQAPDKRPLGIGRAPVMPEDRQSQLKLLIARGKGQGYLTYAQVND